jgi:hypothetical protein
VGLETALAVSALLDVDAFCPAVEAFRPAADALRPAVDVLRPAVDAPRIAVPWNNTTYQHRQFEKQDAHKQHCRIKIHINYTE